jgi:hypothetical protein
MSLRYGVVRLVDGIEVFDTSCRSCLRIAVSGPRRRAIS